MIEDASDTTQMALPFCYDFFYINIVFKKQKEMRNYLISKINMELLKGVNI